MAFDINGFRGFLAPLSAVPWISSKVQTPLDGVQGKHSTTSTKFLVAITFSVATFGAGFAGQMDLGAVSSSVEPAGLAVHAPETPRMAWQSVGGMQASWDEAIEILRLEGLDPDVVLEKAGNNISTWRADPTASNIDGWFPLDGLK